MQPIDSTHSLSAQTRRTFLGSLAGGAAAFSLGGIALSVTGLAGIVAVPENALQSTPGSAVPTTS